MSIAPNLRSVHDDVLKQAVVGSGAQGITPYSAIGELSRRINEANRMKQMQGQMAQQQNQPQPPIAQQVVAEADMDRGIGGLPVGGGEYAAGGVVAFARGEEVNPYVRYDLPKGQRGYGRYDLQDPNQREFYEEAEKQKNRVRLTPLEEFALGDPETLIGRLPAQRPADLAKQGFKLVPGVGLVGKDGKPVAGTAPQSEAPVAPAARPRPVAQPPVAAVQPPAPVAQPDVSVAPPQADLEAELQRNVAAQQKLMGEQKGVAPEVQAARKRAEDMAQASVTRREADRAKMEEEMKARSGRSFTENTELIGSMLGGLRGAKTLGDALAGAGAAAGVTTTAQRKEQMEQQALMRIEANAIDTLKQAQADKQVAIATGDVDKAQAADKAIAEASTALTQARQKMRSDIAKTKAERESAAAHTTTAQAAAQNAATNILSQRALEQHYKDDFKAKMAQAAATAGQRDAMMDLNREKLAEQQYKNSTDYKSIQKELEGAKTMYRMSENPKTKLRLDRAIAADAALRAKFTGETPAAPPGAPALKFNPTTGKIE